MCRRFNSAPRHGASAIETPSRAVGALRRVPIGSSCFCERGGPLSHFPPGQAGSEPKVRRHCFVARFRCRCASAQRNHVPPTEKKRADGLERRPPVGTAARRAAAAEIPTVGMAPFSARTPQRQDGVRQRAPTGRTGHRSPTGIARETCAKLSPPLLPTPNGAVGHRFALPGIAPFHAGEGERADPIIWVSPGGGRRRCASAQRDARY